MAASRPAIARFASGFRLGPLVLLATAVAAWFSDARVQAQDQVGVGAITTRAVGGVMVDPAGMLENADVAARGQLARELAQALQAVPAGLGQAVTERKVSLKRLDAAIGEALAGGRIPDAILYLGGLQKIDYVVVSPEEHDIWLVGPGEGWTLNPQGAVVGATSGRPVMLLDDLVVALRLSGAATKSVISCSIEPTQEGLQRLRVYTAKLRTIGDPATTAMGYETQLGPQQILLTGVPETSHFARVMVAADYRMKRISMGLEPSPVAKLPSYMDLLRAGGRSSKNMLPRFWLGPDYEPLVRDEEGLIWQLRKASVKALAENDFLDAAGVKHQTGTADPVSQHWAKTMTACYDDLAKADPVFGQLRNCMDLAIVSALIVGPQLPEKAGVELPNLMGPAGVAPMTLNGPKQVASKASLMHYGRNWTIACGGVSINPWQFLNESQPSQSLAAVREKMTVPHDSQWWAN